MNDKAIALIAFSLGAAVGSVVTWRVLKTRYEQLAQEEIDSVKEAFSRRKPTTEECDDVLLADKSVDISISKPSTKAQNLNEYKSKITEAGYTNYSSMHQTDSNTKNLVADDYVGKRPYVITPSEFGDLDDYDTVGLKYYADGVLADELDEPIEDIESVVGVDSLDHFGEYENDTVYVRNERLKIDYEILLEPGKYPYATEE